MRRSRKVLGLIVFSHEAEAHQLFFEVDEAHDFFAIIRGAGKVWDEIVHAGVEAAVFVFAADMRGHGDVKPPPPVRVFCATAG